MQRLLRATLLCQLTSLSVKHHALHPSEHLFRALHQDCSAVDTLYAIILAGMLSCLVLQESFCCRDKLLEMQPGIAILTCVISDPVV